MKKIFLCIVLLLTVAGIGLTQDPNQRRFVSVLGEAEMSVMPDHAIFTLEVVTIDKDLKEAKRANDLSSSKTLTAARAQQISNDDVQTESFTISPKYRSMKSGISETEFVGYEVKKRILITLRDLEKIDSLLENVLAAGVNRVIAVSFDHSKMRDYVEKVRAAAVRNARTKAQVYANQLGQTVGKAYSIREEGADTVDFGTGYGSGSGSGTGSGDGDGWGDPQDVISRVVTFAIGKIKIEDKIYVVLALE
jgi:hypothetical protein